MLQALLILGTSFGLSLVLTPAARRLARRWGMLDRPDGRRKIHQRVTPVFGGVPLLLSVLGAVGAALVIPNGWREPLRDQLTALGGLAAAAWVICLVGMLDDRRHLRGRTKILGQLFAIVVVLKTGVVIRNLHFFGETLDLGLLAVPFTCLWLLGAINSLNLIDGMDGLLSSVGAIVTLGLAAMAALVGQWAWAGVALALTGALLGFLRYNFPPASIFLGDSGSMLIGLTIGVLGLQSSLKAPTTAALAAPVALLTIPFVDTAAAILRRKLTGRSIFSTDRGHLHHCLLRRGLTHRSALLCVAIFCGLAGAGALASLFLNNELIAILSSATVVATLVATHLFGYGEFLLVKERLRATVAGWLGRPESAPRETEVRLQGSADWPLLWAELTDWACRNQLRAVRLDVNAPALHEGYHARWSRPLEENESCEEWRIVIPLLASGQTVARVEMTGQTTLESFGDKIASLAEITHDLETVVSVLTQEVKSDPPESLPRAPFAWRLKHAEAG